MQVKEKIHRPSGPFPSLPGGMDIVIKKYFDTFRPKLPPELEGKVEGELFGDTERLNLMRNWRTGLVYQDASLGAQLRGALDDLLVHDGTYLPLDYKTRGFGLKEDSHHFYLDQLNLYELLLRENGFATKGEAWLIYFYPTEVTGGNLVRFEVVPKRISTDAEAGRKLFAEAVAVLSGGRPKRHSKCDFCSWSLVHDPEAQLF